MSEQVEWVVAKVSTPTELAQGKPSIQRHTDGAQSVFGLTTAQRTVKALGGFPWVVLHEETLVSPKDHEAWLKGERKWSP